MEEAHDLSVSATAVSGDGKLVASGSHDESIRVWDATTSKKLLRLSPGLPGWITNLIFSPDASLIASVSDGDANDVQTWHVDTGENRYLQAVHSNPVRAIAFSPDGKSIASADEDRFVFLRELETGNVYRQSDHERVVAITFRPDGQALLAGTGRGSLRW